MKIDEVVIKVKIKISWWSALKLKFLGIGITNVEHKRIGEVSETVVTVSD